VRTDGRRQGSRTRAREFTLLRSEILGRMTAELVPGAVTEIRTRVGSLV
jgi:hypothetical protein